MGTQNSIWGWVQIRSRPVKRSVLFKRVFGVVIITILITALFTTLVYTYVSRSVFTQLKEDEMLPKARALGRILLSHREGELDSSVVMDIIQVNDLNESLLNAYVVVADATGEIQYASDILESTMLSSMDEAIQYVLAGNELRTEQIRGMKHYNLVVIGTPINGVEGVIGAVLMFVPLVEAMTGMEILNQALLISLLISLPIVAIIVYYVIGLIVRPLRQMGDVAIKMASGNFQARADDTQRGEIGQLGHSLNYLARALGRSINELTIERNRLKQIIDGLSEGLVAVDVNGSITHSNPALHELFASVRTETDDEKLSLIPDINIWLALEEVIARGEVKITQITLPDCIAQMSIAPLHNNSGEVVGAVGLFRDITESERLERTRRDYVANVSHEMRTPLTAMRGLIEPLSDGMVTSEETRARYYSIMMRETMRLSRLIDDLMELSRLQTGTLALDVKPMRLQEIFEDLEDKYTSTAEEHGIRFFISSNAEAVPTVLSNRDRIEQILVILLDNAMKYTPEEGTISIDAEWDEQRVTVSVSDTGVGISPEDQPYVFDRFYKVDKAHSGLGSGLGLSIAKEMLQLMGEDIWLKSEADKGSTFSFTVKRGA